VAISLWPRKDERSMWASNRVGRKCHYSPLVRPICIAWLFHEQGGRHVWTSLVSARNTN
jgi:hypothetical protein